MKHQKLKCRRELAYLTLGFSAACFMYMVLIQYNYFKVGNEMYPPPQVDFADRVTLGGPALPSAVDARATITSSFVGLKEAIRARVIGGAIVLVVVDSGYIEMAINLHRTSFEKLQIDNYLFVGIDHQVCSGLRLHGVVCVTHEGFMGEKNSDSNWGSTEFMQKTHFKTRVVLQGLQLGFQVLITDVDVVFFKNPFPYFTCSDCDIEISNDISEGNSGFYLARPTSPARTLHASAWEIGKVAGDRISNQKALNRMLENMQMKNEIKIKFLSKYLFPNGVDYFESGHRYFADSPACSQCVMVHNNWILTKAAKVYRFKETGLWLNDRHQYYSSTDRKYILFANPVNSSYEDIRKLEKNALYSALHLAKLLNRTVILPRFHSYKPCTFCHDHPLNSHYSIASFDKYVGIDNYRENSFLSNPLVPSGVVQSTSPQLHIRTRKVDQLVRAQRYEIDRLEETLMLNPSNLTLGPSRGEVLAFCAPYSHVSVLRFHSLYGVYEMERGHDMGAAYDALISAAFKRGQYRQL
ncbi:hypothetical protein CAPTEDRAFT_215597 [Capitella teleta]|uniref:Nucleotide-diphospho-sugar transferase domain-containing protein n=1 Tax=Capitella teleta TaxID=283909 RepID=R7TIW0_CAPTE|nr:hypothetical protein CAPTEDRAFT_215597 [Capitella teleta]|eukprot:ELT93412.1 hypothetical protein CAPTEDRAFT_215597 [Capitella teleta]